ncbi:putative HKD family nuclease [uncultured phage cr106_1]|uniref:Putative HKD family nuclease n=1 Tax=uncultured phage cr106_1 TaxID=2772062 RepID=A0A7M1RVZ4_9CAUD|nr:putative HKD family nuclease [uncultured phage cr106_1]QOR58304.1 putative HKD family nuclease [uncultured phage cr106_1]
MNRKQAQEEIMKIKSSAILCELPTSFGKSKIGIDLALRDNPNGILIVVPRLVLINNWKEEFIKWGLKSWLDRVYFSTYVGLNKHVESDWDCVIFDEVQHMSERCREFVSTMTIYHSIMLSATVTKDMKWELSQLFPDFQCYTVKMKDAIDNEILPDPRVFLIPLELDNKHAVHTMIEHPKAKIVKECLYKDRWSYLRDKSVQVHIKCTAYQYVTELGAKIDYWKKQYMRTRNEGVKTKWLFLAGQRLKFLSQLKNPIILSLLERLKSERVLTFCSSIEQTEVLGENCINSKSEKSSEVLSMFNHKKINHITACNMLNEGMNLVDCRIGLYANLNSSDIIIKQRLGRILRHKEPIIIIPYFVNTREEELIEKMAGDYNPDLIVKTNLNKITL